MVFLTAAVTTALLIGLNRHAVAQPQAYPRVSLVLDSSATLAWIYSDETTEPIRRF